MAYYMRIFVLTANYELRVSRKSHSRDHPNCYITEDTYYIPRLVLAVYRGLLGYTLFLTSAELRTGMSSLFFSPRL